MDVVVLSRTHADNLIYVSRLGCVVVGCIYVLLFNSRETGTAVPNTVDAERGYVILLETVYLITGWLLILFLLLADPHRASVLTGP